MPDRLPIYDIESDIIARLKSDRRLILSAPTGSGKSTQVPQMLLRHGFLGHGQVVILQPRRLATRLLAARVAQELGVPLGQEVGYQIRFENVTSAKTKIRFVTEGVLLRQMIDDPQLKRRLRPHLRRISRAASLRRHHAGARAGFAGATPAGFEPRRHVRDAERGGVGEIFSQSSSGRESAHSSSEESQSRLTSAATNKFSCSVLSFRRPGLSG
jgi:hypothetical protein